MIQAIACNSWNEYTLLDSGNFEKLERFGKYTLIRPEPQAVWAPGLSVKQWQELSHATFRQTGSHNGTWIKSHKIPENWVVSYPLNNGNNDNDINPKSHFKLKLALTAFKHVGVFPEQTSNWDYIHQNCLDLQNESKEAPKVLNLFAYTGGASLAAAAAGAKVTHVDAIRQVVGWANDNRQLSNLPDMRWLVEDALKFTQREAKRNNLYEGIILDPPSFGHGPKGERWVLEDQINILTQSIAQILAPNGFLVFNCYSIGFSALILESLLKDHLPPSRYKDLQTGELYLVEQSKNRKLPAGVFARLNCKK